jgi:predicted nucleotidyltransferase
VKQEASCLPGYGEIRWRLGAGGAFPKTSCGIQVEPFNPPRDLLREIVRVGEDKALRPIVGTRLRHVFGATCALERFWNASRNEEGCELPDSLFTDRAALAAVCRRFHVRRLSLFGSTLRGTARPDSDIDLLVEFEPGREPGLIALGDLEARLSALVGGRRVDLRTPRDLSRHFRSAVVEAAQVQYAA